MVLKPHDGFSLFAEAQLLLRCRKVEQALVLLDAADAAGHSSIECSGARWMCYMLQGEYDAAWRQSDFIREQGYLDKHSFWDGLPIDGKRIIVRCLHGLGDTLQYARYLPLLTHRAATVTLQTQPTLKSLFLDAGLADQVITWGEAEPKWNQQIETVELPYLFRTTIGSIPRGDYLSGLRPRVPRNIVGVVWASGAFDPSRSIPLPCFETILQVPGIRFVSFQGEPDRLELSGRCLRLEDGYFPAIPAAAKRLAQVDLLITVDTMMAHLAGSIGIPVWTLLPFECDWRWMMDRPDTPWYPNMRLFRQHQPGDWSRVLEEVAQELSSRASSSSE